MNELFTLRHVRHLFFLLVILAALDLHGLVAADSETPVPPPSASIEEHMTTVSRGITGLRKPGYSISTYLE